jgi:hypothetical protein
MASNRLTGVTLLVVSLVTLASTPRRSAAEPPDPQSSDGALMAPYGDIVRSLTQRNGATCCSESDCRPAQYRVNDAGNYEVYIRKLQKDGSGWENGPDKWVEVPGERVTPPNRRPHIPFGIACWRSIDLFLSGGFSCFTPGTDT